MHAAKLATAALAGGSIATVLLVTGCSTTLEYRDTTRPTQPAAPALAHCPASAAQLPTFDDWGRLIGPGQVPDSFRPARVVHCTWDQVVLDDTGARLRVTVDEARSPSITPKLTAALRLPDQDFAPLSDGACSAVATPPQYLILVDANGKAFAPRLPETPCGNPRDEVARAIADLTWAEHQTYRFDTTRK